MHTTLIIAITIFSKKSFHYFAVRPTDNTEENKKLVHADKFKVKWIFSNNNYISCERK